MPGDCNEAFEMTGYGKTEKEARDALSEIGQAAATDEFVPRKAVTVEQLDAGLSLGVLIGEFDHIVAVPGHADYADQSIGQHAAYRRAGT